MSRPGCSFNFETSPARSPLIKWELFHASFFKVLDATNFGMLLNRSANPSGSFLPGHAAAKPSYVTRPRRSASEAKVSSNLNLPISSFQYGKDHFSGDSTTPSSDTNTVAASRLGECIDIRLSLSARSEGGIYLRVLQAALGQGESLS